MVMRREKTIFNGQCFPRIAIFHLPTWVSFWWNNWRSVSTLEKIKELKTNFWSFPGWSFPGWNLKFFSRKGKRVFGIADSRHEILPTGALDHPYALCTDDRDSRRSPWKIHVHKQFDFWVKVFKRLLKPASIWYLVHYLWNFVDIIYTDDPPYNKYVWKMGSRPCKIFIRPRHLSQCRPCCEQVGQLDRFAGHNGNPPGTCTPQ